MSARALSVALLPLAVLALALVAPKASAAPIHIDRSFGRDGISAPRIGASYGWAWFNAVSQQPDGRILATYEPGVNQGGATIERYLANGKADPTFAPQPAPPLVPPGMRVTLPDGSVLVTAGGSYEGWLERLKPDGTLDTAYGNQGRSETVAFGIRQIVPLPSGQVVVAGSHTYQLGGHGRPTLEEVAVGRLDSSGKRDRAYGNGGSVGFHNSFGIDDRDLQTVLARPSGGVLVVVNSTFPESPAAKATLVGLNEAGALDPAFGNGGVVRQESSAVLAHPLDGGGVDIVGNRWGGKNRCCADFSLTRLTASGGPDPNFGDAGVASADFGTNDRVATARWEADGSVVLAGSTITRQANCAFFRSCGEVPAIARFGTQGRLDRRLGEKGLLRLGRLQAGVSSPEGNGVRVLNLRTGGGFFAAGGSGPTAFIAAVGAAGTLDSDFADKGILVKRKLLPSQTEIADVAVDRGGRILVVGSTNAGQHGSGTATAVFRYKRDGSLDRGYGGGAGYAFAGIGLTSEPAAVAVDRAGRALVVEASTVSRLTPAGRPDKSFGARGVTRLPSSARLSSVLALPGGKVLAVGRGGGNVVVVRLLANGKLDRSFRRTGINVLGCGQKGSCGAVEAALDRRGRILLAGYASRPDTPAEAAMAVGRLLPNGRPDHRFGHRGWVISAFGRQSGAMDVAMQGGEILVAGWSGSGAGSKNLLLRFRPDGKLDRTFASAGVARRSVPPFTGQPFFDERMSLLPTTRRIFLVRTGEGQSLLAYGRDGRRLGFAGRGVAPGRTIESYLAPSPIGALQGGNVVIAWSRFTPGQRGSTTNVALQRFATR